MNASHVARGRRAGARPHDGLHVNWLGLSGETDWDLMLRIVEQDLVNEVVEVNLIPRRA